MSASIINIQEFLSSRPLRWSQRLASAVAAITAPFEAMGLSARGRLCSQSSDTAAAVATRSRSTHRDRL